jgi:hypothetical protein
MLVVERLECFGIPFLRSVDGLGFIELVALSLCWVGQVAFSGRNPSDAAKYLYVVWLAVDRDGTKVTRISEILELFYVSWDSRSRHVSVRNPLPAQG